MNQTHIYYLAALIDGEGSLNPKQVNISVSSTDLDILETAQEFSGMGNITGPYMAKKSTKPFWLWTVGQGKDVARLLCAITPLMSSRRRGQTLKLAKVLAVRSKPTKCLSTSCLKRIESKMRKNTTQYCNTTCRVNEWRRRGDSS